MLDLYAASSERFSFTMIDPQKRPELAQQYEVTQYGTLVLASGEDSTRITESSEEALTNALIRFTGAVAKRIYFSSGHGEPDLEARETPEGLGQLKAAIENEGAEVFPLLLAAVPDVPADADLLVIAGPQRPFLDNEVATLERYLDRGGRALFLLEPRLSDELLPMLEDRGLALGNDVIIDQVVQLFAGPSVGVEPVVADYGFHPITEQFRQNTLFRLVRSVRRAEEVAPGITVTELAMTSSASWAETEVDLLFETGEVDPEGDDGGPISIAAAVSVASSVLNWTEPAIATAPDAGGDAEDPVAEDAESEGADLEAETESEGADPATDTADADQDTLAEATGAVPPLDLEGRMVVVGDAEWVSNSRLTMLYNEDFALNMVAWLTGGSDETIAIRPRTRRSSRISMTEAQNATVFYTTVLLLPEIVLLGGMMIWWRRRRR